MENTTISIKIETNLINDDAINIVNTIEAYINNNFPLAIVKFDDDSVTEMCDYDLLPY